MLKQEIGEELTLMFSDYIPEMLHKMSQQQSAVSDDDHFNSMLKGHDNHKIKHNHKERIPPSSLFDNVLLSSSTLRSVKDIRCHPQTMSLTCGPDNQDIFHSASLNRRQQVPSSSLLSDDKWDISSAGIAKPARKQRRVISLRKSSVGDHEAKVQSIPSVSNTSTPFSSPRLDPAGSPSGSHNGNRRTTSILKSRSLEGRSPSVSPALYPQKPGSTQMKPSASPRSPAYGPSPPLYLGTAGDDFHIPSLDFEHLNARRKQLPRYSRSPDMYSKIRTRNLSNVATPEQIFSSASLSSIHSVRPKSINSQLSSARSSTRSSPHPKSSPRVEESAPPPHQHPTQFFLTTNPGNPPSNTPILPLPERSSPLHENTASVPLNSNEQFASFFQLASAEVPYTMFEKSRKA